MIIENISAVPHTKGIVLHRAFAYDIVVWLRLFGRERAFREKLIDLARIKPGDVVLDVGCGTGSLAIAAKRPAGPCGTVCGIDASPEMIARAAKKARKTGADVAFKDGIIEALPFPNAQFDVVLSSLMLHHLSRKAREQGAREIRRVLKPGGHVLAVDFETSEQRGPIAHLHRRHGHVKLSDMVALFGEAGLTIVESGPVGLLSLNFIRATVP